MFAQFKFTNRGTGLIGPFAHSRVHYPTFNISPDTFQQVDKSLATRINNTRLL